MTTDRPAAVDQEEGDEDRDGFDGPIDRLRRLRRRIQRNRTLNLIYRTVVAVVGFAVIALGVALLPLPGPGWLIIFLGLGIIASEFEWSRRLLAFAKRHVRSWTDWVERQNWFVRILLALACVAIVAGAIAAYVYVMGVPSWLPSWVPLVRDLPMR